MIWSSWTASKFWRQTAACGPETPWVALSGFTLKGGGSYMVHEQLSVFGNLGYLSKAPQFNSVIDINNNLIEGYKNQFVKAVEFGAKCLRSDSPAI